MFRTLTATVALSALLALPLPAQVTRPTNLTQIRPGSVQTVESLTVKDGVISLIGTNGRTLPLPSGTFKGPGGSSIIVATGRITQFTPPSNTAGGTYSRLPIRPLEIETVAIQSGRLFLIGTNGSRLELPDGTFMAADGVKIVVQNRTISEIGGS